MSQWIEKLSIGLLNFLLEGDRYQAYDGSRDAGMLQSHINFIFLLLFSRKKI